MRHILLLVTVLSAHPALADVTCYAQGADLTCYDSGPAMTPVSTAVMSMPGLPTTDYSLDAAYLPQPMPVYSAPGAVDAYGAATQLSNPYEMVDIADAFGATDSGLCTIAVGDGSAGC